MVLSHHCKPGEKMLGNTLVIVNPTARSGKAAQVAAQLSSVLNRIKSESSKHLTSFTFHYTVAPHDATKFLKSEGPNYNTVLAVGGDGIVNESVNGLMALPPNKRPTFGLIPCGNGDDFARSIAMNRNPVKSLAQLESHTLLPKRIDVCRANKTWYIETLSFGLDAAIALGTQNLRKQTKRTGTSLHIQCGLDQLKNHRDILTFSLKMDSQDSKIISSYLLAIQNGISYGGGFKVCPNAKLNDGVLDICYVTPSLSFGAATKLFLKAKDGKHISNNHVHIEQAKEVHIKCEGTIPSQIDGERFVDKDVVVKVFPSELEVLMP